MYDKEKVNSLFKQYVETKDDKVLEKLIFACEDMIGVVLSRFKKFSRHFEDVKQDVKLIMWRQLPTNPDLADYLINPFSYLFLKIRRYVDYTLKKYTKDGVLLFSELSPREETMVLAINEDKFLDPEKRYLVKEAINNYFRACQKCGEKHINLKEDSKGLKMIFKEFEKLFKKEEYDKAI